MRRFGCSERNALRIVRMSASTYRYKSSKRDESALKLRIKEITNAATRRPSRQPQAPVPPVPRGRPVAATEAAPTQQGGQLRQPKQLAFTINEAWSMDFVADALFDCRKLRMLTVVDCYTRECLAIDVGQSLTGEDVVESLNRICAQRGLPKTIKTDNGSEFISKAMDKWAYERRVEIDFSRPGKPTDNARVESFNERLRQECLNTHWFLTLDDAKAKIAACRVDYDETRPHSALDWATPAEFARRCGLQAASATSEEPEVPTSERY